MGMYETIGINLIDVFFIGIQASFLYSDKYEMMANLKWPTVYLYL